MPTDCQFPEEDNSQLLEYARQSSAFASSVCVLCCCLQAGILSADKVLTVSPNYASEISANAEKGVELDKYIR